MVSTDEGTTIDSSDEHIANARSPKSEIREPDSNVSSESLVQREKQLAGMASIDGGMQIDLSDEQSTNAAFPTCDRSQPGSNIKCERL
jgi:hypothetical protein